MVTGFDRIWLRVSIPLSGSIGHCALNPDYIGILSCVEFNWAYWKLSSWIHQLRFVV